VAATSAGSGGIGRRIGGRVAYVWFRLHTRASSRLCLALLELELSLPAQVQGRLTNGLGVAKANTGDNFPVRCFGKA